METTDPRFIASWVRRSLRILCAASALTACVPAIAAKRATLPPNGCPIAGWVWVRWNDVYGLNLVGMVQSYPGWTYGFRPGARVVNSTAGANSEIEVVLVPVPLGKRRPPTTSDQHVYGYWSHTELGVKPNWVTIRCGKLPPMRSSTAPGDLFNPEPPKPPPTFPPPPPPRPGK